MMKKISTYDGFDFLSDTRGNQDPSEAEVLPVGPNLADVVKMTPRRMMKAVLEVFEKLGGVEWLYMQAKADPKEFIQLLKKVMPTNFGIDGDGELSIRLIDQFGNSIEVGPARPSSSTPPKDSTLPPPSLPRVAIKDSFDEEPSTPTVETSTEETGIELKFT